MIGYMQRTRSYYSSLGYPAYQWAHYDEVPFAPTARPIGEATLALITTAAPYQPTLADQGPGAPYNAAAKFFTAYTRAVNPHPDLRISHLGYDRKHTSAEDPATFLPLGELETAVADARLGALAGELIGVPTNRSRSATLEQDAPAALAAFRTLNAEVALLVPS